MRHWQEYLIVIVLGLIVSLAATVVVYLRAENATPTPIPSPTPTPITTLPDKPTEPIRFTNLNNESVFDNKALTLTGEASPEALVVIFVNDKDFLIHADNQGYFSLDINLDSGSNTLTATTVDADGNSHSDSRLVIYTNKSLEEILLTEEELKAADTDKQNEND